ncbi:18326_t:CDS:2 [Racocetra fulgida]|uniref:18326_t:CDS:1 n=1 Tax=Racocetra fulgida TaxID=60492 RepID=A0A9N8ZIW2_9GLOM|nr:18326_t:CDS:2 [Racocetra fulgida]
MPKVIASLKLPFQRPSNKNYHYHRYLDEDESSSDNDLFSSIGKDRNSSTIKEPSYPTVLQESSHSTAMLNMQNARFNNSYSAIHIIPNMVKTHPDWNGISTKLRQAFENFCSTYNDDVAKLVNHLIQKKINLSNHDIEEFIIVAVWEKLLKKHIDILDYDTFKNQQSVVKALETFVARSLKIHVEYLIAESNRKDSNYTSMVLNRIKGLDNITINITFPVAKYSNQQSYHENSDQEYSDQEYSDQQSYHRNIDQDYSDQNKSSGNLYDMDDMECNQEFDDNLSNSDLENIYNEFSKNMDSDNV